MSEVSKYRELVARYCAGNVLDIGSQGDPVVPWAIQVELPEAEFQQYSGGMSLDQAGVWRGDGLQLPFKDDTLDAVFSSHLIEDFEDWRIPLREWSRVLKTGGHLVILTPDDDLFNAAVVGGQPPNCAHRHCGKIGEISGLLMGIHPFQVLNDRLTNLFPGDYTILFAGRKLP